MLAIDPTSPFSGGAILGDRVRMQQHALDPTVFIRSMATRGHLGGLALAVPDAVRVLGAAGFPFVIVETVGVGQMEVEVASAADTTMVVVTPGWGDSMQANKAGLLEIADLFVINKADRPGAREARRDLEQMLDLSSLGAWRPPIIDTVASTGEGLADLWRRDRPPPAPTCATSGLLEQRRADRMAHELRRVLMARSRTRDRRAGRRRGVRQRGQGLGRGGARPLPGRRPPHGSECLNHRPPHTCMSLPPIPVSAGEGPFDPSARGSSTPCSTRSSSAASSTPTTTAPVTSRACARSSTTSSGWASTASGCCPFYPSPFRDSGYDISDFFNVHPDYGSIGDLVAFLEDAHSRGIRVIADLVMNHTSDQHPWFIESRSSRDNAKADWYVWNDDDQRWPDARVVFTDTERSNWTWDDTRQQYYWHRFFHHQPDLNYDNPEVADTMIDLVRFWLDLGFDGFRLDAVPYLYQRDGTAGEHLPETHAFIKRIRKQLEADYPGRILLAEANGWPSDVADYFGDGDECHLCFHFPLMPRLFMAVRREQRYPDHRDPGPDTGHQRLVPVGHLLAQPRRADPRDGHRRGPRLPHRRVRQGPADEAPHGDRPPSGPPARQRPAHDRAPLRPLAVAARGARSSTTATSS